MPPMALIQNWPDGQSSSPRKLARAVKCFVEGIPKSTENKAPAGFEILSRQKSEHFEFDEQTQLTGQGVIKDPDSLGGGGGYQALNISWMV